MSDPTGTDDIEFSPLFNHVMRLEQNESAKSYNLPGRAKIHLRIALDKAAKALKKGQMRRGIAFGEQNRIYIPQFLYNALSDSDVQRYADRLVSLELGNNIRWNRGKKWASIWSARRLYYLGFSFR